MMALVEKILAVTTAVPFALVRLVSQNATMEEVLDFLRSLAADILALVPSGRYGTRLFDALSAKTPQRFCECVLFRENSETGALEVYLTKRLETDTAYPGQWHCPGSAIRNGETFLDTAKRVAQSEFQVPLLRIDVVYEGEFYGWEKRGWGCHTTVLVTLFLEPSVGRWYPVDSLPKETVDAHRHGVIPVAVKYWENRKEYEEARAKMRNVLGLESYKKR